VVRITNAPAHSVEAAADRRRLQRIYRLLERHHGPTGWWPGDTPFEIAVGAILTQNTAWTNVEKAIARLKKSGMLSPRRLLDVSDAELHDALRPSGYFRVKSERIRSFSRHLVDNYAASMARMARRSLVTLRPELLSIHGIGPETADDILLYACRKPVFVVDAYTRRILYRHGFDVHGLHYENLRAWLEQRVPADIERYQEFHALIVLTGKDFCRSRPRCEGCPLAPTLRDGEPRL
jgi:endonuclease III related protein